MNNRVLILAPRGRDAAIDNKATTEGSIEADDAGEFPPAKLDQRLFRIEQVALGIEHFEIGGAAIVEA